MKRHSIALAACMTAVVVLASASSWEGSAMMGPYGDFPASGYYAACNSFPRNTSVEIVNLENGRSITVIVTRGLESSGVFMMLSVEAANALGLQQGKIARVRASEPRSAVELAPSSSSGSSYDPDLNPRLMAAEELMRLGYELGPTVGSSVAQKPVPPAVTIVPAAPAPVVTPAPAVSAVQAAAPKTAEPAKPSAIEFASPSSPAAAPRAVAVAEPTPVGRETPEPMASAKPKPVRTIVLPQLPEPSQPVSTAAVAVVESAPEAVFVLMPEPDETPLRVEPSFAPKRYDAPSVRPDVSTVGPKAPSGRAHSVALADPSPVSDARAAALARTSPKLYAGSASVDLYDPSAPLSEGAIALSRIAPAYSAYEGEYGLSDPALPASELADAIARFAPARAPSGLSPELVWPELEADEIPEIVLAGLNAPLYDIPSTSLAEGEIILPEQRGPSAIALETPAYGAAETMVALEDAEAKPEEKPTVETPSGVEPYFAKGDFALAEAEAKAVEKPLAEEKASASPVDSGVGHSLTEAVEHKPETAPYVESPAEKPAPAVALESPREFIVAIEPAGPKPPAAPAAPVAPVAKPASPVSPPSAAAASVAAAPIAAGPVVTGPLEKGRYYIQIGAFGNESVAKDTASGVGKKYTVLIQKTSEKGKDTWRVFVGPLSRDESGVALVRVRAMGYKDAFLKSGS